MNSNQDFPVLGTDSKPTTSEPSSSATNGSGLNSKTANNYSTSGNNSTDTLAQKLAKINRFSVGKNLSDAEFPALHKEENASSVPPNVNSKTKGVNSWSAAGSAALSLTSSQLPSNSLSKNTLTLKLNSHEEFPGLVSSTKKQHLTPNLSIQLSSKPRQPHGSSGNTENQHEPKTNSHSCVSSGRNSRDHPVVTRLEGTQNITFLNPPSTRNAHTSGASVSVSGDVVNGNNTGFKDGLSKTDSGWYVLKKGKVSKANADEEQSVTCLSITSLDDFPDLEVKNGKCEKKEARIVVPINNSWTNSQDTKPSKVIESSSQPQKVIGKNKKKKKSYTASNGTDSSKDAALKSEPEKNDARCPDNHLKLATDDCDENCKSGISAVEIKRSELTLEGLSPNSDNNNVSSSLTNESIFTVEDFPQLSFTTMLKSYQTPPSLSQSDAKPSRPPPGFSLPHNTSLTTTKPPPGFEMCCVSGIQSFDCNRAPASPTSVTFTNSSGQNFALPATIPYHSYYPPNDFQKRNQKLTLHLYNSLSEGDFSTFKEISGMFRQNIISANDYYQHCVKLIGKERFEIIFPELLILLPDISKQQDLLAAYNTHKKEKDSRNAASESYNFLVCASCQQVLTSSDFVEHENIHQIDTDFPALGNSLETVHVSWLKQK